MGEDQIVQKQDQIETVQRELGGNIISFNSLPINIKNLFTKHFTPEFSLNFLQCIKYSDDLYRITLFDSDHKYIIRIDLDRDYIGCIMSNRKPYPGETWTRGNDYPDGKFINAEIILRNILNKIFQNAFCPISKSVIK